MTDSVGGGATKSGTSKARRALLVVGVVVASAMLVSTGAFWLTGGIPKNLPSPAGMFGDSVSVPDAQGEVDALTAAGQLEFDRGEFALAQEKFLQAARLEPENPWLAFNLGAVAGALGDWKGAVGFYELALELNSDLEPAQYNLAYTLTKLGDYEGAKTAYQRSIALNPSNPSALWNFGLLLYDQGEIVEAQDLLRRAAALDVSLLPRLPESVTLQ